MSRWLIPLVLVVTALPQVVPADSGGGGGGGGGGVWILPGPSTCVPPGGMLSVQDATSLAVGVTVKLDDGTQLGSFQVTAGSTGYFQLPNDDSLIGHTVKTTATNETLSVSSENSICSG